MRMEEFHTEKIREKWFKKAKGDSYQRLTRYVLTMLNRYRTPAHFYPRFAVLVFPNPTNLLSRALSNFLCIVREIECVGRTQKATTRKRFYTSNSKNTIVAAAHYRRLHFLPERFTHSDESVIFFFFFLEIDSTTMRRPIFRLPSLPWKYPRPDLRG